MKKIEKIIYSILIIMCIFSIVWPKQVHATFDASKWKPSSTTEVIGASKLESMGNVIIGTIRTIASITSVAVLVVIGIKYMIGSVEEKAEYKKTMLPYVIGAVLVFGITNILSIVINVTSGLL